MKETGIISRVDDLGRIVIPKEVRRQLKVTEGTPMELFVDGDKVIFRKYSPGADFAKIVGDLRAAFLEAEEHFDFETETKIKEHIKALMEIVKESED